MITVYSILLLAAIIGLTASNIYIIQRSYKSSDGVQSYVKDFYTEAVSENAASSRNVLSDVYSQIYQNTATASEIAGRLNAIESAAADCRKSVELNTSCMESVAETYQTLANSLEKVHGTMKLILPYARQAPEIANTLGEAKDAICKNTANESSYEKIVAVVAKAIEENAATINANRESMEQCNRQLSVLRNLMEVGKRK